MATSGELAHTLSKSLGFKLGTVNYYGQHLRDAGLLAKHGRGTSAATMTEEDAINWLVAMCAAETAKSAPGVVGVTLTTPRSSERWFKGSADDVTTPEGRPTFLDAKNVRELLMSMLADEKAGRLDPVHILLDFYAGGGEVELKAFGVDEDWGFAWAVDLRFIRTLGSGGKVRYRDPDEMPLDAKRQTINRIWRGVFEDINAILAA